MMKKPKINKIEAQPGFQTKFLSCSADIVIGGGGAGVGKTYSLLLEAIRKIKVPDFGAVCFRRTYPQIAAEGGLWDESNRIFPLLKGIPNSTDHSWMFNTGSKIKFSHLQHEKNVHDWQGSQIPLIMFDELTHFTLKQFLYLLSRNRTTCGVKPYVRATCNPDPNSFIANMIDWAIDEQGFIIPEMENKIRYFSLFEDEFIWGDSRHEVVEKHPEFTEKDLFKVKSFAFIEGDVYENKKLLDADPNYIANLEALPEDEKLRLLKRNWKVRVDKNVIVDYDMFSTVFTNDHVKGGRIYITCDVATEGKDCLIIWVWKGRMVVDLDIIDKNSGREVYERILAKKRQYNVMNVDISFDASGVGGGLTGFLAKAKEYKSIKRPIGKNQYRNLKSQLAYEFSYSVNQTQQKNERHRYYIVPEVANMIYPFKSPALYKGKKIKWILEHQLKVLRRKNPDGDNKLELIPKDEMKALLGGISPDFIESLIQRELFDLIPDKLSVRKH